MSRSNHGWPAARAVLLAPLAAASLVLAFALTHSDSAAEARGSGSAQSPFGSTVAVTGYLPLVPSRAAASYGDYANCRFGAGQVLHPLTSYDTPSLNLGWYVDWHTQPGPPTPGGVEYVQVLRVSAGGTSPSGSALASLVAANPGAWWLVGNEPDCIYQDNVTPQVYARVYHDAYAFITGLDPTARVAAGGIVQPTPLRMQYLDLVLSAYASRYGEPLPTDAWSIHSFILREASCAAYPDSCWGAEIPPGISASHGLLYALDDIDRLDIFQDRIVQFRQWMRDRGYRHTALLVTEYGTLLPYYDPDSLFYDSEGNPFDEARARQFMLGTFDFFRTATDASLGYPADEDRLVQRWLWYSLDDAVSYGGALFNPYTLGRMGLGDAYAQATGAIPATVDLLAVDVGQQGPIPYSPSSAVTLTVRARVSNVGNTPIAQPVTVRILDGAGHQIGPDQVIGSGMRGCAHVEELTVTWPDVPPGTYTVRVIVDPADTVDEEDETNNQAWGRVMVARGQLFLPLIASPPQ